MLFHSVAFFVFLPCVYLVYWALARRSQNAWLLAASYLFYGWWDWRFLGLIIFSSGVDFWAARALAASRDERARRGWLVLSLAVNLGVLGVFKYLDFCIASLSSLLSALGIDVSLHTLGIVVPVGISFYTFQSLSYTIDVYRGKLEPCSDAVDFFCFVALFPQLVAGPIERARSLLPQMGRDRAFDRRLAADGLQQMLYGFLIKLVVADNLAPLVEKSYSNPDAAPGWLLLLASYGFALQIFGDFAGYSHIAIGCARLFGLELSQNFRAPYYAVSLRDFWRRWHISLSTFFRDYLYVPLGGRSRRRLAVVITFTSSGLWHGAGWNFVLWGFYHGVWLLLENGREASGWRRFVQALFTFHVVVFGWILFRSPSAEVAFQISEGIFTRWRGGAPSWLMTMLPTLSIVGTAVALLGVAEWRAQTRRHPFEFLSDLPLPARVAFSAAACVTIAMFGRVETVPFIYFQF